jgi:hypothetical protein
VTVIYERRYFSLNITGVGIFFETTWARAHIWSAHIVWLWGRWPQSTQPVEAYRGYSFVFSFLLFLPLSPPLKLPNLPIGSKMKFGNGSDYPIVILELWLIQLHR